MITAAGTTNPNILTNLTAIILAVIKQETKIEVIRINLGEFDICPLIAKQEISRGIYYILLKLKENVTQTMIDSVNFYSPELLKLIFL